MIFLDNAASTKILPVAIHTLCATPWGNPNSSHYWGEDARKALDSATAKIRALLNLGTGGNIYYYPTATAAIQDAINSAYEMGYAAIRYPTEHHSALDSTYIQRRTSETQTANGHFLHVRQHSNNETGELMSKPDLHDGDLWLCDATASMGHVPIDTTGMSYIVADGLKFNAVPGCAFLCIADYVPYFPFTEGGTPSVGLICAMASALEWHYDHMKENTEQLVSMRNDLSSRLLTNVGGAILNTTAESTLPHILNISFSGVDGKALALMCSQRGVMVSAGAACTSGNNEPSHVLMSMYGDEARARSAIRISFSHENTVEECEEAAKIIAECVEQLRAIS